MRIDPDDIITCLGHDPRPTDGPVPMMPPIVQTSLFAFESFEALCEGLSEEHRQHVYSRGQNPTVEAIERQLASLERGERCKCFASGMAAISSAMYGLLEAGDHVLFVNQVYGPTLELAEHLRRFGIEYDIMLELDLESVEQALRPETKLVWLESPGTMLYRMLDLPAVVRLAKSRGILVGMDNTWATPLLQKPLTVGVDIVGFHLHRERGRGVLRVLRSRRCWRISTCVGCCWGGRFWGMRGVSAPRWSPMQTIW